MLFMSVLKKTLLAAFSGSEGGAETQEAAGRVVARAEIHARRIKARSCITYYTIIRQHQLKNTIDSISLKT